MVFRENQVVLWTDPPGGPSSEPSPAMQRGRFLRPSGLDEAKALLAECRVDVVIVGVGASWAEAGAFVRWVRRRRPGIPIVVTSAGGDAALERRIRRWPVTAVLARPVDAALLAGLLGQLRWRCLCGRTQESGRAALPLLRRRGPQNENRSV